VLRGIKDEIKDGTNGVQWWKMARQDSDTFRAFTDGALILAKYFPGTGTKEIRAIAAGFGSPAGTPPGAEEQRLLLTGLLDAANPAPGFELLKTGGLIAAFWPELAVLDDVDHSKEFHPEGNVWKHTMEALRYRKPSGAGFDLRLSLGLLLHDAGKPLSQAAGSRRFDGHAELGERQARRFLERLGFNAPLVNDVCYLVRNHMLPAALPRLPLARTGEIMESSLFPALLELYRCDESSSFKGLDGYYRSSAAYQSYLKNRRNPYRSPDGKLLRREQIINRQYSFPVSPPAPASPH
jgi:poly(A) polymerase